MNFGMNASREAFEWSGIPAEGELLTYSPAFPRFLPVAFRLAANGLSFPSRLRGSGGMAPSTSGTPLPRFHPLICCLVLLAPQVEGVNTILTPDNNI